MMSMGWGFFPWPFLFMIPLLIVMMVMMMARSNTGRGLAHPGCDVGSHYTNSRTPPRIEDPVITLRERYVRGEIEVDEFEQRLEGLLRSTSHTTDSEENPGRRQTAT